MTGTYSSLRQATQERTTQTAHPGETIAPHAHIEVEIRARDDGHLDVRVTQDRQLEIAREIWILHAGHLFRPLDSLFARVEVTDDGLEATISTGPLATPLPYRLLRV